MRRCGWSGCWRRRATSAMLAPLAEREILYRLMTGEQAARLRQIATGESRLQQVNRAIGWIKRNYDKAFSVETLAQEARMSPSALHQHFKAVTAMSPLQYQKQLRLQEARRLILGAALDAASAGFRVGYDSPSQFSREYRRLFGAPPLRDAARLRGAAGARHDRGLNRFTVQAPGRDRLRAGRSAQNSSQPASLARLLATFLAGARGAGAAAWVRAPAPWSARRRPRRAGAGARARRPGREAAAGWR